MVKAFSLLIVLCCLAAGFQFLAVNAFEVGTDHAYIPKLQTSPSQPRCAKQR
jgi:hypothetical protein